MANKSGMAQAEVSVAALPCSKQRLPNTPLFNAACAWMERPHYMCDPFYCQPAIRQVAGTPQQLEDLQRCVWVSAVMAIWERIASKPSDPHRTKNRVISNTSISMQSIVLKRSDPADGRAQSE